MLRRHRGLVEDCQVLLPTRDELTWDVVLYWSAVSPIIESPE